MNDVSLKTLQTHAARSRVSAAPHAYPCERKVGFKIISQGRTHLDGCRCRRCSGERRGSTAHTARSALAPSKTCQRVNAGWSSSAALQQATRASVTGTTTQAVLLQPRAWAATQPRELVPAFCERSTFSVQSRALKLHAIATRQRRAGEGPTGIRYSNGHITTSKSHLLAQDWEKNCFS